MQYDTADSVRILQQQDPAHLVEIEVLAPGNRYERRRWPVSVALALATQGGYWGVGHDRRIKALRKKTLAFGFGQIHAASKTTRRVRNDAGLLVAAPPHLEHKPWRQA